ncbi:hypothetical protein HK097_007904, partial [Rhizophlyctis rosea]
MVAGQVGGTMGGIQRMVWSDVTFDKEGKQNMVESYYLLDDKGNVAGFGNGRWSTPQDPTGEHTVRRGSVSSASGMGGSGYGGGMGGGYGGQMNGGGQAMGSGFGGGGGGQMGMGTEFAGRDTARTGERHLHRIGQHPQQSDVWRDERMGNGGVPHHHPPPTRMDSNGSI